MCFQPCVSTPTRFFRRIIFAEWPWFSTCVLCLWGWCCAPLSPTRPKPEPPRLTFWWGMSQSFGPVEDASETLVVAEAWKVSGKCAASAREVLLACAPSRE